MTSFCAIIFSIRNISNYFKLNVLSRKLHNNNSSRCQYPFWILIFSKVHPNQNENINMFLNKKCISHVFFRNFWFWQCLSQIIENTGFEIYGLISWGGWLMRSISQRASMLKIHILRWLNNTNFFLAATFERGIHVFYCQWWFFRLGLHSAYHTTAENLYCWLKLFDSFV